MDLTRKSWAWPLLRGPWGLGQISRFWTASWKFTVPRESTLKGHTRTMFSIRCGSSTLAVRRAEPGCISFMLLRKDWFRQVRPCEDDTLCLCKAFSDEHPGYRPAGRLLSRTFRNPRRSTRISLNQIVCNQGRDIQVYRIGDLQLDDWETFEEILQSFRLLEQSGIPNHSTATPERQQKSHEMHLGEPARWTIQGSASIRPSINRGSHERQCQIYLLSPTDSTTSTASLTSSR